ncbi:hypothetical protein, partial [Nocardia cyriacigeorgica]|uniref:hypothetical protein n=1 Tax=Nocardia cyriacigeorgica TaxID=135487 RepID=UPI003CC808F2
MAVTTTTGVLAATVPATNARAADGATNSTRDVPTRSDTVRSAISAPAAGGRPAPGGGGGGMGHAWRGRGGRAGRALRPTGGAAGGGGGGGGGGG